MNRRTIPTIIGFIAFLLFAVADRAWALQSHGPPEGIYAHQMAHVLFSASLIYLYWHTRKTPELTGKGWKYLQLFCIFMILWNIWAFAGHEFLKYLQPSDIINKNTWNEQIIGPVTLLKASYYLAKMDHFLFIPALTALMVSLRTFYRDALQEKKQ